MKYLLLNLEKMVVHSQSGIARNTAHIHERRTMSLSELMLITEGEMYIRHMEDYHLVKNDIFFLPQGIEHYGTKPTDCQLHWHHFFLPSNSYIVDEKDLKNESTGKDTVVLPMHFNLKDPETVFLLSYQLEQYPWTTEETQKVRNALVTAVIGEIALEYRHIYQTRSYSAVFFHLSPIKHLSLICQPLPTGETDSPHSHPAPQIRQQTPFEATPRLIVLRAQKGKQP